MSYARTAVTRMTLDMSRLDLQRSETVTLGDTNRRWEVTLINGGAPFRLPPNWTAALTGIKPDGTGLLNGCSVADGKIIYDFAAGAEIATCAGSYPVQFDIWDEVGDLVASPKIYVNVLADVRPHAELDSKGQYTLISDLIGRVNQTDADVDLLGETALAQGDDIAALKKKVTTAGFVTIPPSAWDEDGGTPYVELVSLGGNVIGAGDLVLIAPEDDATKEAAEAAQLTMSVDNTIDNNTVDFVTFARAESGTAPDVTLNLRYVVIHTTDTELTPVVALVGVGGGVGGGVDADAVTAIIEQLVPAWAREPGPPAAPVTSVNGKTGEVTLTIPSEASDVNADPAGTAERKTAALREEVNGKLADYDKSTAVNNKISSHNTSTESHEDLRLELQRLADRLNAALNSDDTSLDDLKEIVAYIKANKTLIDGVTASKVNVTDIVNNLTTNTANVPLSAAQGVALKLLIDSLEEIVEGKVTAEQVAAKIANALKDYQPKGDYLTPTTGDQRYAKPSDIPTVPKTLPNPYALEILGKTYNGSSAVALTVEEIIEAIKAASGGVVAYLDGSKIVLSGNLPDATYTAYYEVDGELVEIGDLAVGAVTPDPVTYTITWVVDGKTTTETYEEGETPIFKGSTDKAADDEYTYTFAGWSPEIEAVKADATYTATYTQTAKPTEPTEPTNFADPTSSDWKTECRLTTSIDQTTAAGTVTNGVVTNYIEVQSGDYVEVTGIDFSSTDSRIAWDFGGNYQAISKPSAISGSSFSGLTYDSNSFKATVAAPDRTDGKPAQIRFSGPATNGSEGVVINIKRDGNWL